MKKTLVSIVIGQFIAITVLALLLVNEKRFEGKITAEYIRTKVDKTNNESSQQPTTQPWAASHYNV